MGSCCPLPTNGERQISSNSDSTIYRGPKRRYSAASRTTDTCSGERTCEHRRPPQIHYAGNRREEWEEGGGGRAAPRPIFVNDRPIKYSTAAAAARRPKRHRCHRLRKRLTHLYVHRSLPILNNMEPRMLFYLVRDASKRCYNIS